MRQEWFAAADKFAQEFAVKLLDGMPALFVKRGLIADLAGLTLATVGYQSLAGSLFFQASMQAGFAFGGAMTTPGGRITNYPITSLEMLSVLSNTQVVFAHLIGLWLSIWMLQRIYRAA